MSTTRTRSAIKQAAADLERLKAKRATYVVKLAETDADIRSTAKRLTDLVGVPLSEGIPILPAGERT